MRIRRYRKDAWGQPETVLSARETGKSITRRRFAGRAMAALLHVGLRLLSDPPGQRNLYMMDLRAAVQAPGVQQQPAGHVALLVKQRTMDRLQQQAGERPAGAAVLQLYRRGGTGAQAVRAATG